jgi:DUF4097 and DUF4098 domain-containing protein YvlB
MRTPMTYPIRFWAILLSCLLLYQFSTDVRADSCKYEKDIELTLDLDSSDSLAINAAAGDLEVRGVAGLDKAVINGRVCVSKQAWLDDAQVETIAGNRAQINVNLPAKSSGWSLIGNSYARIDLVIEVPHDMTLEVKDSSGDASFHNVAAIQLQDSSGDIEIEDSSGPISIRDSSGDIDIERIAGDFTVESDSSGDINISEIGGTALVKKDSSGDIRFTHITHDAIVEVDSSGDISAKDIGGDFRVLKDGSGSISSSNVSGDTDTPKDS